MLDRRRFLQRSAVAAAVFGLPLAITERAFAEDAPRLPAGELLTTDPQRYWAELRRQWLLAADRIKFWTRRGGRSDNDIGAALAMRDLADGLRQGGIVTDGPAPMRPKDRSRFLSKLDEAVNAVRRAHPSRE
jgi:YaiI/YqxD family uncharacterized protein